MWEDDIHSSLRGTRLFHVTSVSTPLPVGTYGTAAPQLICVCHPAAQPDELHGASVYISRSRELNLAAVPELLQSIPTASSAQLSADGKPVCAIQFLLSHQNVSAWLRLYFWEGLRGCLAFT